MGNRATITTAPYRKDKACIYVHWNGGPASVAAFCKAAKELNYRSPGSDESYALARLNSLISVFFGLDDGNSLGLGTNRELNGAGDDNGVYVIGDDWQVVERRDPEGRKLIAADRYEYNVDKLAFSIVEEVRAAAQAVEELRELRKLRMKKGAA